MVKLTLVYCTVYVKGVPVKLSFVAVGHGHILPQSFQVCIQNTNVKIWIHNSIQAIKIVNITFFSSCFIFILIKALGN